MQNTSAKPLQFNALSRNNGKLASVAWAALVMHDPLARGGVRRYLDTVTPEEYIPNIGEVQLNELSLCGLADLYGSDKGSIKHRYTDVYQAIVHELVNPVGRESASLKIIEYGVACGASLRMWANYLPLSQIYGVDVRGECEKLCSDLDNVHIIHGDATTGENLQVLAELAPFDMIVDDASHISEDIVLAFRRSWALLRAGGYYVIEDLSCTYNQAYTEKFRSHFNADAVNDRGVLVNLLDNLMRACDVRSEVSSFSYHPQLLCVKKL
jgi:hypothetical protein